MITAGLALGAATLLIASLLIYQLWSRKLADVGPPEPAGRRPLMGHLHLLSGSGTSIHRTLAALSERYGPMFFLRLGRRRTLFVSNMELAKECFAGNDRAFADRPGLTNSKYVGYDHAMIAFARYGTYWREIRKICVLELLSVRRLEMLKHIRNEEISSLMKCLYRESAKEEEVELQTQLRFLTLNILLRMVAGKRYFVEGSSEEDEEGKELLQALEQIANLFGLFTVSDAIPWLEWLDLDGHVRAMKKAHRKLDKIVSKWVADHRRRRDSGETINNPDFIDILISRLQDEQLPDVHPPDAIINATAFNMVIAGTTTTSDTLEWALSLLLNHPHELKKAQDELDFHVGLERQVVESDISKLDPRVWSDPEEFEPSRFVTTHREVKLGGQCFELIPFGSGKRSCPGLAMGLLVTHLALARLLHGFECRAPGNAPVDMSEGIGATMPKAVPLHALLRPRLPSHLY
ncbi:unnamed protein product [Victoria cruziana]